MQLIKCRVCGAPISLRSKGFADAFTPQADRLRRKYGQKLKPSRLEIDGEDDICLDCWEKSKEKRRVIVE